MLIGIVILCNKVIAVKNINIGDELCFDYNQNETSMACPFNVDGMEVKGKY